MKKKLDKSTKEFAMMQEFWRIWQEFFEPEDNEEYWDHLTKTANDFENKFGKSDGNLTGNTASYLMLAVLTDIENRYKASK